MSLDPNKSASNSGPRVLPDEGTQIIRNYGIIDIGTQMESFNNRPPEPVAKVMLLFEFPKKLHVFDQNVGPVPLTLFQEYTFIASERAKLMKVIKAWGKLTQTPKTLNLKPYLGQYCMATIVHQSSKKDPEAKYAAIGDGGRSISPVMDELKDPNTRKPLGCREFNENIWLDLDHFNWNDYNKLPKYVQNKIQKSKEWLAIYAANPQQAPVGQTHQPQQQNYSQPAGQPMQAAAPQVVSNDLPNF